VPDYIINGIALDSSVINSYPVLPTNITAGRNLLPGETGKVVLSENSSAYFGKGVGDTVSILGEDFEVVGIYGPTGVADKQLVYMNIADAQAITNSTGIVTSLKVFAKSSDVVSSVANDISALHPELSVNTAQERLSQLQQMQSLYNAQLENAKATMNQTQAQANGETLIAVTATSVIVLFVMLYTVRERTKEIGTLKAIGASNGTVMSQFLVEGILLSLLAGVVGVAIGIVAAPALSSVLLPAVGGSSGGVVISTGTNTAATTAAVAVTPELIMIGLAVSVVLGAIGSLYPAWRAAKIRPAEAMRYE
jgi:putative ABC transport system permease protein